MTEGNNEKPIQDLAEEYLSALEEETNQEELEDAKEQLKALQERYKRFEEEYGESDPATKELDGRVSDADERVGQLEAAQQIPENLAEQLLEQAIGFMLTPEWLKSDVIEALNQVLIGKCNSTLMIEEIEISGPDDVDDLNDITRFDIIDTVRKLAMDKLGQTSDVSETWESIADTTKEEPFRLVASLGSGTPDEVLEHIEDSDAKRETIRGRLKNATQMQINPYIRKDGTYHLSTAGTYLAQEYAESIEASSESTVDSAEQEGDGQTTLDQKIMNEESSSDG